jgi:hypothetical protein
MLTKILCLSGMALMVLFAVLVSFNNQSGWQFLIPAVVLLGTGGLAHDLAHPKPRRREVEDTERPLKRKKRRVRATAEY